MIKPDQLRQIRRKVFWDSEAVPLKSLGETLKVELADVRRFATERRKWVLRICRMPRERTEKQSIRREIFKSDI